MATVFKKTFTKPLPTDADRFTRKGEEFARWKDAKGNTRTAKVTTGKDGSPRLLIEAETFTAKYRAGRCRGNGRPAETAPWRQAPKRAPAHDRHVCRRPACTNACTNS